MTKRNLDKIDKIIHKGGFVVIELRKLIDVLEDIRSVESIEREFKEAFEYIEKTKGSIMPSTKKEIFRYINCKEKYKYENNYDGFLRTT